MTNMPPMPYGMDPYQYQYYAAYYQQQMAPQKPGVTKSAEEAKKRLNAYAAEKKTVDAASDQGQKKSKNKELKKFFDEENPEKPAEKAKSKVNQMDKMAEIAKEIEKEKEIHEIELQQKIKELQSRYKKHRTPSRERDRRRI